MVSDLAIDGYSYNRTWVPLAEPDEQPAWRSSRRMASSSPKWSPKCTLTKRNQSSSAPCSPNAMHEPRKSTRFLMAMPEEPMEDLPPPAVVRHLSPAPPRSDNGPGGDGPQLFQRVRSISDSGLQTGLAGDCTIKATTPSTPSFFTTSHLTLDNQALGNSENSGSQPSSNRPGSPASPIQHSRHGVLSSIKEGNTASSGTTTSNANSEFAKRRDKMLASSTEADIRVRRQSSPACQSYSTSTGNLVAHADKEESAVRRPWNSTTSPPSSSYSGSSRSVTSIAMNRSRTKMTGSQKSHSFAGMDSTRDTHVGGTRSFDSTADKYSKDEVQRRKLWCFREGGRSRRAFSKHTSLFTNSNFGFHVCIFYLFVISLVVVRMASSPSGLVLARLARTEHY